MRSIFFSFLLLSATGAQAEPRNPASIETRYGTVDVVSRADSVDIRFQGKVASSVAASGASLYRVTPHGASDFVLVDASTPGLHCRHVFVLLELSNDGSVTASNPFGSCKELTGVEFRGESPLIHLGEPATAGHGKSAATTDFEWRDGNMVQVAGQAENVCAMPAEPAGADERVFKVSGRGRLPFLSAPRPGCEQPGIFIIPGDAVRASRRVDAYTFVRYVNPKNGRAAQGWVLSSRLAEAPGP